MGVYGTRGLANRAFTLIALAWFQGEIAQTWDSDKDKFVKLDYFCAILFAYAAVQHKF